MSNPTNSLRYATEREEANADHTVAKAADNQQAHLRRDQASGSSLKRPNERPVLTELGRWLTRSLALLAVVSCIALVAV
jgi:hypothetical protein